MVRVSYIVISIYLFIVVILLAFVLIRNNSEFKPIPSIENLGMITIELDEDCKTLSLPKYLYNLHHVGQFQNTVVITPKIWIEEEEQ